MNDYYDEDDLDFIDNQPPHPSTTDLADDDEED